MRIAPFLSLPPVAIGIAAAVWMISNAAGPTQVAGDRLAHPVRVITVTAQEIRPNATAWGNLRAAESWIVVSEVQGEVVWRHHDLEPGRLIPSGTEVLRIDPTDYELALAQAEADLDAFDAEAAQLSAEAANTRRILDLERERLALTEADLMRTRRLAEQGTASQARLDEAERSTLLARRTVAELENSLTLIPPREARIASQTARTRAARDRARRSLDRTVLTTPFDLRVTEVSAERFQTIAPGQVVIRADGIATAEVVSHLPVDRFRRLVGTVAGGITLQDMMGDGPATGIEVTLSPLSDPAQLWPARVSGIEGGLDPRARTVPILVTVDDPYAGADPPRRLPLVPNMRVQLDFKGAPQKEVITIPEAALHAGMVRIVGVDDVLELRPVTVAFTQDGQLVIAEGLTPGDRVVLDDIVPAIPGMPLLPVEGPE